MKELNLNLDQVLAIMLRALDHIDTRLVDHGHRVSYIVYKMLQTEGSYTREQVRRICTVAALHDIGAYKTEEIDQMMRFESENVFDHSIYGYLFLKHMTPLGDMAQIVLYHHLSHEWTGKIHYEYGDVTDMIHFADRIDVLLQTQNYWLDTEELEQQEKTVYAKKTIALFRRADELHHIKDHIMDGSYLNDLNLLSKEAEYSEEMLLEFIKMIAYSIDFRSETTVSHVITTVGISLELGRIFNLDEISMKKLQFGAYLHDIGKISTPLDILEKPGKLNGDEMSVMKEHILATGDILKGRIHEEIVQIAYRHHEKLDGSGYPEHLTRGQLSRSDQIVAVADVMSALSGRRSYKESFPKEEVTTILSDLRDSGKLSAEVINAAILHYDLIMGSCQDNIAAVQNMYEAISKEFYFIKRRFEEL